MNEHVEVWEDIDQRVYVRSLARALAQHVRGWLASSSGGSKEPNLHFQVGKEGILRRDDSGDRIDPDLSLQKNGIRNGASLRFDVTPQSSHTRPKEGQ